MPNQSVAPSLLNEPRNSSLPRWQLFRIAHKNYDKDYYHNNIEKYRARHKARAEAGYYIRRAADPSVKQRESARYKIRQERFLKNPWAYPGRIFTGIRANSKKLGRHFDLTIKEFSQWLITVPKQCFYCGLTAERAVAEHNRRLNIDRKDNYRPYAIDNICLACTKCNEIKGQWLTCQEMKRVVEILGYGN